MALVAALALGGCAADELTALEPCPSGEERVEGECQAICAAGYAWEEGACAIVCPAGSERDGAGGCTRVCPTGWELSGAVCLPACPAGTERDGEVCRAPCPEGESRVGNECRPPCAEGYERIDGVCTRVCPAPLQLVGGECLLVCPDGYAPLGDTCVRTCPPSHELRGDTCVRVCPEGYRPSGDTCVRACPADTEVVGEDCVPLGGLVGLVCDPVIGGGLASVIIKVVLPDSTVRSALSVADGTFSLPGLPSGPYQVQFTFPDASVQVLIVLVEAGAETRVGPAACPAVHEACANGADDDGDARVDCADPDCLGAPGCIELCNGRDDDANGVVDDAPQDPELGASCYEGPLASEGVGACVPGVLVCAGGTFACADWMGPTAERCDGQDNDCDGEVPPWDAIAGSHLVDIHTQVARPAVDILFVVDDSVSMEDEQQSLAQNFTTFINRFLAAGDIDYQIGVITTDILEHGVLVAPMITPATPDPVAAFTSAVNVGTYGSTVEQGLATSVLALRPANVDPGGPNQGFLRPDALLSVIYVSDEDDQSVGYVTDYADQLRALKADRPGAVLASAIAGDLPSGCTGVGQVAEAGIRYEEIAAIFGGLFGSICATSWGTTMDSVAAATLAALTHFALSYPAMPATIDVRVCDPAGSCTAILPDPVDGWTYDPATGAVTLNGTAVPAAGEQITISYDAACVQP